MGARLHLTFTPLTRIVGPTTYKERVCEMFTKQIPNAFSWYVEWIFWFLLPIWLPFQIVYCCIVLAELVLDTILFPISCVPILRWITTILQSLFFAVGVLIGWWCVPLVFDDYEPPRKKKKLNDYNEK